MDAIRDRRGRRALRDVDLRGRPRGHLSTGSTRRWLSATPRRAPRAGATSMPRFRGSARSTTFTTAASAATNWPPREAQRHLGRVGPAEAEGAAPEVCRSLAMLMASLVKWASP
jgi:hypothetical protein